MTARPQDVALLPLPQELVDALGDYGCARSDGVSDPVRLYRWQLVCDWIKDYAEDSVTAALASAQAREDELRAEVERWRGHYDDMSRRAVEAVDRREDAEARAERLAEALRYAVEQVPELATVPGIAAALTPNAAQPGETNEDAG